MYACIHITAHIPYSDFSAQLVESIEFVRNDTGVREEWFGLILLPLTSFAADGTIALAYIIRTACKHWFGTPPVPTTLADHRAIDLSVQFTLFWLPFVVLLSWWTGRPFSLLFGM